MPTPDRTTLDAIVAAARDLLEDDGLPGVTMQGVAVRVGVRAPSLYKRVQSRDRLVQLVAEQTLVDLTSRLDATTDARALLDTYRAFGKERPAAFRLVMTPGAGTPVADTAVQAAASAAILRVAADLAGESDALEAARLLTAWATGFISMELNGAFRLGGDIDRAWEYGVTHIVTAAGR
ncbi:MULTISPECIES: WHG domain-containing protein [unclassified Curtobacterium]|uniref:TetR/AcrR family transcriptional regulator n=1 Tax=unclassified Curtobacterium TaxID=257496 RepID=UPI00381E041B